MKNLITGHCRDSLRASDIDFILAATQSDGADSVSLQGLLCDASSRDVVLDDPSLLRALKDNPECVQISAQLFFYLTVRHALCEERIDDRNVADYIASLLTAFGSEDRMLRPFPYKDFATEWAVDLLAAIGDANEEEEFLIRTHLANYTLFMTGLFPERLEHKRVRRAAPGLDYYESMGQMSFKHASESRLAGEHGLQDIFSFLAEWFRQIRLALNRMCERVLFLGSPSHPPNFAI